MKLLLVLGIVFGLWIYFQSHSPVVLICAAVLLVLQPRGATKKPDKITSAKATQDEWREIRSRTTSHSIELLIDLLDNEFLSRIDLGKRWRKCPPTPSESRGSGIHFESVRYEWDITDSLCIGVDVDFELDKGSLHIDWYYDFNDAHRNVPLFKQLDKTISSIIENPQAYRQVLDQRAIQIKREIGAMLAAQTGGVQDAIISLNRPEHVPISAMILPDAQAERTCPSCGRATNASISFCIYCSSTIAP